MTTAIRETCPHCGAIEYDGQQPGRQFWACMSYTFRGELVRSEACLERENAALRRDHADLETQLAAAREKLSKIQELQFEGMPEPWRTICCNVLANGMFWLDSRMTAKEAIERFEAERTQETDDA